MHQSLSTLALPSVQGVTFHLLVLFGGLFHKAYSQTVAWVNLLAPLMIFDGNTIPKRLKLNPQQTLLDNWYQKTVTTQRFFAEIQKPEAELPGQKQRLRPSMMNTKGQGMKVRWPKTP